MNKNSSMQNYVIKAKDGPSTIEASTRIDAFLNGRIRFTDMPRLVEATMLGVPFVADVDLDCLVKTNAEARAYARALLER